MNLQVRRAQPSDYPGVSRIFEGARAQGETLQLPYPSPEAWRKRLTDAGAQDHQLVAELDGEIVGMVGIHGIPRARRSHAATLGLTIVDAHHGKGIGTRLLTAAIDMADNWLQLLRLELTVYVDNKAALHVYGKAGFVIEGTHRAYALRDGHYVDTHTMARLHPDPPAIGRD